MRDNVSEIGFPDGTMSLRQFASIHNVAYRKAYYHVINHSGEYCRQYKPDDYFDVTEVKKPYSTRLFLTPEQQQKALAYWGRWGFARNIQRENKDVRR